MRTRLLARLAAPTASGASSAAVLGALALIYVVWGSTYYAIRVAIDTIPPLLMGSLRFLVAGGLLYAVAVRRGDRVADRPRAVHWRSAFIVGVALLTIGNGGVILGEDHVPSAIIALLVATVPLWMALLAHLFEGERMRPLTAAGIGVGLLGVALLLRPGASGGASPWVLLVFLIAPLCWASGSLYARSAPLPARPQVGAGMEMIAGGAVLFVVAAGHGELGQVHLEAVSMRSLIAVAYLVVFGSIITFSAYVWLLNHAATPLVSTYAYVNPLVAVLLGWWLLGEHISTQTLAAAAVIVVAVAMILGRAPRAQRAPALAESARCPSPAAAR